MAAGQYDTQINLERRRSGRDAAGQPVQGWTLFAAGVWADVRHLTGLEAIKAGAETSTVKASIRIRWRAGIGADMRVVVNGAPYEIKSIAPNRRGGYIDLACEAKDLRT
jgi:SPP1 family predicted phage head-tail adaptor